MMTSFSESTLFQQYVYEYIQSERGSSDEFYWYDKILKGFRIIFMYNSTILCREYIQAFVDELKKREDFEKIEEIKNLFNSKQLNDQNELLYRLLAA